MGVTKESEGSRSVNLLERYLGPSYSTEGLTAEYVTREVLLGTTIGFAQIPESVAFAFLAHVKPPVALHAAWMVGLLCSLFGGRPGMVNGATGAFAAIIATFLPKPELDGGNGEGVELLFPSVILAGILMLIVGKLGFARFILLLPSPVMIGFCNGLAVVIGWAQLHPFQDKDHGWKSGSELAWMLAITFAAMATMEFLPKIPLKIFKVIPSSLCAILVACFLEFAVVRPTGARTDTIGDVSEFTSETAYPKPFFLNDEYTLEKITGSGSPKGEDGTEYTFGYSAGKIIVQGVLLCLVGSIESLMTSQVVEAQVKTPSNGARTLGAMGFGNILSGFFGGMGGNAMIGLSTINVLNGGRGRLAPVCTALLVLIAVAGAYPLLNFIPVAALAGIMLVVVIHTFKWFITFKVLCAAVLPMSLRKKLGVYWKIPRVEVFVIILVTFMSIFLNIAYAVGAGVIVCSLAFAWNSGSRLQVQRAIQDGKTIYDIEGPLFFVAANKLASYMDIDEDTDLVMVRLDGAALMDYTAIETLHKIAVDYQARGKEIHFSSLNPSCQVMIDKANQLTRSIVYAPTEIEVPDLPNMVDGFRNSAEAAHFDEPHHGHNHHHNHEAKHQEERHESV